MDIEDIKKAKAQCEEDVLTTLRGFEERTGCAIDRLDVISGHKMGRSTTAVVAVQIDVKV